MFDKDVYTHAFAPCIHIVCAVAIMAPDPCLPETGISNARLLQCYHVHRVVMHSRGSYLLPCMRRQNWGLLGGCLDHAADRHLEEFTPMDQQVSVLPGGYESERARLPEKK